MADYSGALVLEIPTGAEHDVSGASYRRARVAPFMGNDPVQAATRFGVAEHARGDADA